MKRILFITFAVLLSTLSASAVIFNVNGIAYCLLDGGKSVFVTQGGDYTGSVIIPERVSHQGSTYSVTEIGRGAFSQCTGLTSVTIPNSVTSIGESAFMNCEGLTSVTIPNSVTTIGEQGFLGCTGLTSVIIGTSVTSIGDDAFVGCTGLTSVTIGNSVNSIGASAFTCCTGLTSVTIPNSVTTIGASAFSGCTGLTSVTIGNSVNSIGNSVFYGCTGLTSVTIPNSVLVIFEDAFLGCTGLTSVIIGNSVQAIRKAAFKGCTALKKIYSLNPDPPQLLNYGFGEEVFDSYNKNLFVPKGCVPKYKNAEYWRLFKFIGEIEEEGGIDDVIGADSKIKYDGGTITISVPSEIAVYSIDGKLVATANGVSLDTESLTHGTYVVRAADAHGNVQTLKFIK